MKKLFVIMILPILSLLAVSCQPHKPFVLIQLADPQLGMSEQDDSFPEGVRMLQSTVGLINEVRPAFVVVTGDMTHNPLNDHQYEEYQSVMDGIADGIAVYHLPGNHEESRGGNLTAGNMERYRQRYGENRFAFRFGGCGFLGYDSNLIKDGTPEMEAEQYGWMEETLAGMAADCSQIFVFAHCPIVEDSKFSAVSYFSYQDPYREKYINLFDRYGVSAMLAGHRHKPSTFKPGTFVQITAGTCGPATLDGSSSGIQVVKVYPDHFVFNFLPVEYVKTFLESLK